MATKKAGSAKKTSTRSKSQAKKTNVSTVKAVTSTKRRSSVFSGRMSTALVAALIGEFIGTFLLASAYLVTRGEPLYMGFVLVGLSLMVGTLSGAHLNPVITVGAWVTRKVGHLRALGYVVAQLLGAAASYVVLSSFMHANQPEAANAFSQQAPEVFKMALLSDQNHWYVLGAELLGAAVFAFAFAGVWREKADRVARSIQVGFAFFIAALVAGVAASYVKANVALNPAVALTASAVDFNKIDWFAVAVYVAAPLIGGVVGFALRDVVETNEK